MSSEDYTIADQNAVYFLTFTITDWVDVFTRSCYRMLVIDSLNYYIHQNPVRALIVQNEIDYIFNSAGDYAGTKGMVNIITEICNRVANS